MDIFGPGWSNYMERIQTHWNACVLPDDLVLIPGDISWAMKLEQALIDLKWIDQLPGTKVMIRGNHDYWWSSASKVRAILPPSIHIIQNDAFTWNDYSIGGTRLWDTSEYNFSDAHIETFDHHVPDDQEKIYDRELGRLELSLKAMKTNKRIVMTHYPPISADLKESRVSKLLEKYHVSHCCFGHLHNIKKEISLFGEKNGVDYVFTAADYLEFKPQKIF